MLDDGPSEREPAATDRSGLRRVGLARYELTIGDRKATIIRQGRAHWYVQLHPPRTIFSRFNRFVTLAAAAASVRNYIAEGG